MKRDPALQDLSRDHFLVLYHGQQLRRALGKDAAMGAFKVRVEAFLAFVHTDLRPHFRQEEEIAFRHAETFGGDLAVLSAVLRREHAALLGAIEALESSRPDGAEARRLVAGLEPQLTAHVRREENEFFPRLQDALPQPERLQLWQASYAFRRQHRSAQACGTPPPAGRRPRSSSARRPI